MSVFPFLIYTSILSGYAIMQTSTPQERVCNMHDYKLRVAEQVARPLVEFKTVGRALHSQLSSWTEKQRKIKKPHVIAGIHW